MPETLSVETYDHVATVTLTIPTMPPLLYDELGAAFHAIAADSGVRAVVIGSSAKAFSFGLDLPATMKTHGRLFAGGGLAASRTELLALIRGWQGALRAVADCPVPVIAAIHGWCIGGGLDLAAACDVRLASADARFSLRETRLGIVADLGSLQRLPGIIGQGHTRELAFTAKDIDAARAERIGLVNEVLPDRAAVGEAAQAMARQVAANPPLTVRGVKDVLGYGESHGVEDGLRYVAAWNAAFLASEDLGEAMAAFAAKRAPDFKGR